MIGVGAGKAMAAPVTAIKATVKHDIMSTSIPEDNSEEENLSNSPQTQGRRSVRDSALRHQSSSDETNSPTSPPSPAPATAINDGIISESVNLKENFFLKTEENNFPRNEIMQQRVNSGFGGVRKQYMHQQRQQFMGNLSYNNNNTFAQNRNLSKVGGTLSAIAENQIAGSPPRTAEAGPLPNKGPSLETSF